MADWSHTAQTIIDDTFPDARLELVRVGPHAQRPRKELIADRAVVRAWRWGSTAQRETLAIGGGNTEDAAWRMLIASIANRERHDWPANLDTEQVARVIGVDTSRVKQLVAACQLRLSDESTGRQLRFTPAEIWRYLVDSGRINEDVADILLLALEAVEENI